MTSIDALTFAVLAVALTPFAYWEIGPSKGASEGGSSPAMRTGFVLLWLLCIVTAVYGAAS